MTVLIYMGMLWWMRHKGIPIDNDMLSLGILLMWMDLKPRTRPGFQIMSLFRRRQRTYRDVPKDSRPLKSDASDA
jgi:hypothetical protein